MVGFLEVADSQGRMQRAMPFHSSLVLLLVDGQEVALSILTKYRTLIM